MKYYIIFTSFASFDNQSHKDAKYKSSRNNYAKIYLSQNWFYIVFIVLYLKLNCHSPCGSVDWNLIVAFALISEGVTPRAGVWIETPKKQNPCKAAKSLPVRECGLKPKAPPSNSQKPGSLPVRECGLKLLLFLIRSCPKYVTPRAGVWIETSTPSAPRPKPTRHSPYGSVDWNSCCWWFPKVTQVTPHMGVWIETS